MPDMSMPIWTAGEIYLNNLSIAIEKYAPKIDLRIVKNIPSTHSRSILQKVIQKIKSRIIKTNSYDLETIKAQYQLSRLDACFGYFNLGIDIPQLPWIHDFQDIHLPEYFTKEILEERYKVFRLKAQHSKSVIVSSQHAANDFAKLFPDYKHKCRVLRFAAFVPPQIFENDASFVVTKYNLPSKYLYMPNQFWQHKNHHLVFKALKLLQDRGVKPFLVLTGNTNDFRYPKFFSELIRTVSELGIRDQIALLGLVPHDDVYYLMQQSCSILNPSLFEGWSTSVEESKALNKLIILSDIEVHREQNPEDGFYFNPSSEIDLADAIEKVWCHSPSTLEMDKQQIINQMNTRLKLFAETFENIIRESITS